MMTLLLEPSAQGRAQSYSVIKKRQGVSTKTEGESQELPDFILCICMQCMQKAWLQG